MPQCQNCQKPAIVEFGPQGAPLCVDCYAKMAQALDIQIANHERHLNQLTSEMAAIAGVPDYLPKYPERKRPITVAGATFHNITVKDSTVGVVNTGQLQQIDTAVSVIGRQGDPDLAKALRALTDAIAANSALGAAAQKEALEILSTLSAEAAAPQGQRRSGIAKPLIARLLEILAVSADFAALGDVAFRLIAAALGVSS
jgi:hypothetical protein